MATVSSLLGDRRIVFSAAILLRVALLLYGQWQDANSPFKYTDIDYYVFTDASRYMAHGHTPYARDTYRYTPILAWLLLPTTWRGWWFSFGKVLFAVSDIVVGWLMILILRSQNRMESGRATKFACIWLLNPMVATISTRGSSEGLLSVIVVALLWAVTTRQTIIAGLLLGFAVHFKIYPFIYASSIVWWLDNERLTKHTVIKESKIRPFKVTDFLNADRVKLAASSFLGFMLLNVVMYQLYVFTLMTPQLV